MTRRSMTEDDLHDMAGQILGAELRYAGEVDVSQEQLVIVVAASQLVSAYLTTRSGVVVRQSIRTNCAC